MQFGSEAACSHPRFDSPIVSCFILIYFHPPLQTESGHEIRLRQLKLALIFPAIFNILSLSLSSIILTFLPAGVLSSLPYQSTIRRVRTLHLPTQPSLWHHDLSTFLFHPLPSCISDFKLDWCYLTPFHAIKNQG